MSIIKTTYGEAFQALTIALNGLADDGYRGSESVNHTKNHYLDVLVQLQVIVTSGAPAGDKNCLVYAYGTARGGAPYSGGATGKNSGYGGIPGQLIANCPLLGIVTLDAASEVFTSDCFSVASAFGGVVPEDWGIIVMNQTGRALAVAGNEAWYQGVLAEV